MPIHWALGGPCISVTHDEALLPSARRSLSAAIESLNGIECSSLCFEPPRPGPRPARHREVPSLGERWVHISLNSDPEYPLFVEANSETCTARIFSSHVWIDPDLAAALDLRVAHRIALEILEMLDPGPGVSSARSAEGASAFTADDIASFCLMYGEDPYCE